VVAAVSPAPAPLRRWPEDTVSLIKVLGIDRARVLGEGMDGMIAPAKWHWITLAVDGQKSKIAQSLKAKTLYGNRER
jgi:hypothetical protein